MKKIDKMSDQEINIRVALGCGFKKVIMSPLNCGTYMSKLLMGFDTARNKRVPIPDYCNDLNAMYFAEDMLSDIQLANYTMILCGYYKAKNIEWGGEDALKACRASAKQRAKAFILVLEKQ
jgi:hypothetical protein